ncbi:cobalamin-independent methionine synthase II family protein [Aspergillus clavatus NRRL 1]|uniref:Methionine synthase, vitamin-B12 independent, putative n=1 Tax=Aspergillus clavatus (strain ATCC 1007 / CBS 513.65 / DSM 816 / NCTC 3887 / NRRL 1 / QM 1276 / 107) TaxID=344612 RepID=A1CKV3_ASPCL|nr:Methionine synthase, vitamin-B12 independent, putative [Aspergillus clavatus NRRL 1]EAW09777.1 Methionine synthase, vitamin-B12 independent, putative [Aspergillus clavatus NRRL 1]
MAPQLHRNPPFRAEHLGSLLRTDELLKVKTAFENGQASAAELKAVEDKDIKDVVETQKKLGYPALSDGEYCRHMFWGSFFPGLEGFEEVTDVDVDIFRPYAPDVAAFLAEGHKPGETVLCTGKIKHVGSTYVDQFKYLASLVAPEEVKNVKLTLAAPNWYHLRYKSGKAFPKDVYRSEDEYLSDIAKAYQEELQILYDAGCRNVQFDDPNLAYFCSDKMLDGWKADSLNTATADETFEKYIKQYNELLSKRPADFHVGVHICRGNFVGSRHFSEGGYDRIATQLFKELDVDTYYLEYDTPRAGGFEPLKELPRHKNVILGVVTSKFPELEDKEEMKKRVYDAAKFIAEGNNISVEEALKQVGVSPQCGFASHREGNAIDYDGMINKLKLVREIANDVWPGEL